MKNIIFIGLIILTCVNAQAQSPGLMPYPAMNTTQRNALVGMFDGQIIVNVDSTASTNGPLQWYSKNSSAWKSFGSGSGGGGFTNPMTLVGQIIYGSTAGAAAALNGNTTTARQFLISQGTGSAAQAPTFGTLTNTDLPLALQASTTVPTNPVGDNSTKAANDTFVNGQLNAYGAAKLLYVMTSKTQVINTTTPTTIVGFSGSSIGATPVIKANTLIVGRMFHVKGWAFLSMGSITDLGTLSFYLGTAGDSVGSIVCPTSATSAVWYEIEGLCRTTGTGGTVDMQGKLTISTAAGTTTLYNLWTTTIYTINTTIDNTFNMFWTFSVANASNAFTSYQCYLEEQ